MSMSLKRLLRGVIMVTLVGCGSPPAEPPQTPEMKAGMAHLQALADQGFLEGLAFGVSPRPHAGGVRLRHGLYGGTRSHPVDDPTGRKLNADKPRLRDIRLVVPTSTAWNHSSTPYWWAIVCMNAGDLGHISWDAGEGGKLREFYLSRIQTMDGKHAKTIGPIPDIQQFPLDMPGAATPVASGCVPTAAGSLIAYHAGGAAAAWRGGADDVGIVRRIRGRLDMTVIPDAEGFADGKMALAGCHAEALPDALRADAEACGVKADVAYHPFVYQDYKAEIDARRPCLLSCVVPLPAKPQLIWGHEVVGAGYAEAEGVELVGVIDNFIGAGTPGATRWVRRDVFEGMVTVKLR